jgi:hypothetical protein
MRHFFELGQRVLFRDRGLMSQPRQNQLEEIG